MTGRVFGELTVVQEAKERKNKKIQWTCRCKCGREVQVTSGNLLSGNSTSCRYCGKYGKKWSHHTTNHTKERRLYEVWVNMKHRTQDVRDRYYNIYGGRGITVCDEWLNDYDAFSSWALDNGYQDDLTIDRIDVNKGYSPDNCRWVTHTENENNKRDNRIETYKGVTDTLANLCRRFNANYASVYRRLCQGFTIEEAFEKPYRKTRMVNLTVNGETATVKEWANRHGLNSSVVCERINAGWPVEKALNTPLRKRKDNKPWQEQVQ